MPRCAPLALALACVTAACTRPSPVNPVVVRQGDTLITHTTVVGSPDTARLVELWRHPLPAPSLPDTGSDGESTRFVTAMGVAPDGSVLSALRGRGVVRIDPSGRGISAVPGTDSLGTISAVGAQADGRVLVRQDDNHRLVRLDLRGSVDGVAALPETWPIPGRDGVIVDGQGGVWVGLGAAFAGDSAVPFPRPAYLRLGPELAPVDTISVPQYLTARCPVLSEEHFAVGRFEDIRVRYLPKITWALLPDGRFAAGCTDDYSFDVLGGSEVRRMTKEWTPIPVSKEERESFLELWLARMRLIPRTEPWGWRSTHLPDRRPAYQALLAAREGRIWVWSSAPSLRQAAPETWALVGLPDALWVEPAAGVFDVFDSTGRLVGHVPTSEDIGYSALLGGPDPVIAGDTVWAVVPDPAGLAIARFLVRWPRSWLPLGRLTARARGSDGASTPSPSSTASSAP